MTLPQLNRIDTPLGRWYYTPHGMLASFSTIYAAQSPPKDSVWLDQWRARVGTEVAEQISQAARTRGTQTHLAIEQYLKQKQHHPNPPIQIAPQYRPYFYSIKPYLQTLQNPLCEVQLCYYQTKLQIGFAGTIDCIDQHDNYLQLLDFKTANKAKTSYKAWKFQLGAYSLMAEMCLLKPVTMAQIINGIKHQPAQIVRLDRDTIVKYQQLWLADYVIPFCKNSRLEPPCQDGQALLHQ